MYVRKDLYLQVMKVFIDHPHLRDDRWKTLQTVIDTHYADKFGDNVIVTGKLCYDIDRAFRYIQQHIPELRGENWQKRQKMGGRSNEELSASEQLILKKFAKQLKFNFT